MEIKPVHNTIKPNYPTLELFMLYPELLSRNVPGSWLRNKFVATSLMAFLLSGCGTNTTKKSETVEIVDSLETNLSSARQTVANPTDTKNRLQKKIKNKLAATEVAPVFAHGSGSGATGCVVMSPPVFLSEDEALEIILNELALEGYSLSRENCPVFPFKVPPIANECGEYDGRAKIQLEMDAYNPNSNWVIQFITTDDFAKFKNDNCISSVSGYDTKQAAEIINEQLKKQKKTNAVVFYDPVTRIDFSKPGDFHMHIKLAKEESQNLLIAQVRDFIQWLKSNNIKI